MIRGESCPVCDLIRSGKLEDAHGITVTYLTFSRLFLAKDQFVKGYCVLICRQHVIEPCELSAAERVTYLNDLAHVGNVLQQAFQAAKMNYNNILGNVIPHLHTHILPRHFTDSAPNRPINPGLKGYEVYLSAEEYAERINLIRTYLYER